MNGRGQFISDRKVIFKREISQTRKGGIEPKTFWALPALTPKLEKRLPRLPPKRPDERER